MGGSRKEIDKMIYSCLYARRRDANHAISPKRRVTQALLLLRKVDDARRQVDERDALGLGDKRGALEALFPNLRAERRGVDDAPPADPEPDTDVGAPLDCPSDLAVLQPNGSIYRPAANDSEAAEAELLEAAGWIDWDAVAGVGPA